MRRREWLVRGGQASVALLAPSWSSRVYASPAAADARLLLVFLRGAYDAANVLIPAGSDFYYESRRKIALRRPVFGDEVPDPQAALSLALSAPGTGPASGVDAWAMHPALKDSLLPMWERGELAFVPFAGNSDLSRSHFEQQDNLEAGLAVQRDNVTLAEQTASRSLRGSGFLNRLAVSLGARAKAVAFTDGLPLALAGSLIVANASLKGTGRASFDKHKTQMLTQMYRGTRFETVIGMGFELRETVAQEAQAMQLRNMALAAADPAMEGSAQEMLAASKRALTASGFGIEARRMAALMRSRYNIGFIDVGGWDTHVNQGGAQGHLANQLTSLGSGLAGFAEEIGDAWKKTVVVVVSEFGRTFRENGAGGTDHGHGTAYWVAGGSVRGGRIAGEQVAVSRKTLHQDRDWPVLNDNRAVLGGLLKRMYGLSDAAMAQVFPGAQPADLGLL